jgi:transposase
MRQSKDPKFLRYRLASSAGEIGVKPTAKRFRTTPKTVRKWLQRWRKDGWDGLQDQSRAPHHPHRKISPQLRQNAIAIKKYLPTFGALRIKRDYHLELSVKAIGRIWREENLSRRKRKKHQTKNDLRAIKAKWRLFEQLDLDTKVLYDIPELWTPIKQLKIPTVQYTCREVVSGLHFIAYAQEISLPCATLFASIVQQHLQQCRATIAPGRWQTDNGAEFIGAWNAKADSAFTRQVQSIPGLQHHTIPPGAHTWQADVETAHRLIEDEFYEIEPFDSRHDFMAKANAYAFWFNALRKNSYKNSQTPWQIIHQRDPKVSPRIVNLPPVCLDELLVKNLDNKRLGGYDVIPHP